VLGLPEGHLVYAKGNAAHADHVVRRAGIRIHQHALDLDQPPDTILAQVAAIARESVRGSNRESDLWAAATTRAARATTSTMIA
jgi:5-methylcytosine-specific restriction enzyme subunit McrC